MRERLINQLVTMHAYCRPHGSPAERAFINRWIRPLGATEDDHGNWHVIVGQSSILWSCHTDTVHRRSGSQRVRLDSRGILRSSGSCLGADDTAGVFILCELIRRGVPGHYVFHYGEEVGCIGSHSLAEECPDWLVDITHAIALDRRGWSDVITYQIGFRTASQMFAQALADALNHYEFSYRPCPNGLYTDTEAYANIVPECTNISVGYSGAHGSGESLDTNHVLRLVDALSMIDMSRMPVDRDPEADRWLEGQSNLITDWTAGDQTHVRADEWDEWYDDGWDWRRKEIYLDKTFAEVQVELRRLLTKEAL